MKGLWLHALPPSYSPSHQNLKLAVRQNADQYWRYPAVQEDHKNTLKKPKTPFQLKWVFNMHVHLCNPAVYLSVEPKN